MEADEVTVVVHGARNLQGRKPGRCKFSVIFGVGTRKFRTSIIKDPSGNPDWNEESNIQKGIDFGGQIFNEDSFSVQNQGDHVFFTVTEKEDVLGQVQVPVTSLSTAKGQVRRTALKAHKKCPVPQGDLIFQAYVSRQRPLLAVSPQIRGNSGGSPAQLTGFQRLRQSLAISPALPRRGVKRDSRDAGEGGKGEGGKRGSTLSFFNKKLSKSLHDIFHIGRMQDDDDKPATKGGSGGERFGSVGGGLDRACEVPVVSQLVPNMATVHGGTRICVEGRSLGLGKSDIMEFMLCGSDLLDSIEFESESRIYVTTKPSSAGKGDLWLETVSGGQNVIKNVFTFVDRTAEKSGAMERQAPPSPIITPASPAQPSQPSPVAAPRTKAGYREGRASPVSNSSPAAARQSASVQRSASQQDRPATSSLLSASATLPRVKSTADIDPEDQLEAGGRFRKNHQTHARRASESTVAMQRDAEGRSSYWRKIFDAEVPLKREISRYGRRNGVSEKTELQKEIVRLMKENEALQKKNDDLNQYIQDLVAKVMENCPEVLAKMPTKH